MKSHHHDTTMLDMRQC